MKRLLLFFALIAGVCAHAQTTLYVDSSASISGAGTSWSAAFKTLNEALNVANAGSASTKYVINIAEGTYYPTGVSNVTYRDSTFLIKRSGIALYGGYPQGGGTRNTTTHQTVLSGKLNTVKCYHVVVIAGGATSTDSAILDGLKITGGLANGTGTKTYNSQAVYSGYGGGLHINNFTGRILLNDCALSADSAYGHGGGIFNTGSSCRINNCSFNGNIAYGPTASFGGAILDTGATISLVNNSTFLGNRAVSGGAIYTSTSDTLRNCSFTGNSASNIGGALNYAFLVPFGAVRATISNCTFTSNSSTSGGGAIMNSTMLGYFPAMNIDGCVFNNNSSAYGGAIDVYDTCSITKCRFTGNIAANNGAAIYFYGGGQLLPSVQPNFCKITNCIFSGNLASGFGGAISNDDGSPSITNCTFSGDSATNGFAIYNWGTSSNPANPVITNCIIWDGNNSFYKYTYAISTPAITYSIVQQASGVYSGIGNLNVNPLFATPLASTSAPTTAGNYRLQPCSPAINTGLNSAPYTGTLDVVDSARIYGTTIDMGAYEYQGGYTAPFPAISGGNSVCVNSATTLSHTTSGGTWSSSNPAIATVSSAGLVTGVAAGTDTITYIVGTVPVCNNNQRKIITVLPSPAKPTASSNTPVCAGDTLRLSTSTSAISPVFSWTGPGTFTSSLQNPLIPNATAANAGIYRVTITGTNGCVSPKDSVIVTISCLDSVWAGDANADKTVDNLDALEIALAMGSTGNARAATSLAWQPAFCRDWATMLIGYPAINRKHADCNGDGTVGYSDTLAVAANYALTHPKEVHVAAKTAAGLPDLYFDFSGIAPVAGKTISVPVRLGSAGTPVTNIAGIAARLIIADVAPADTPSLSYPGSWLGTAGNTLHFSKAISKGRVDWAYARTDQRNTTGSGTLAMLTFTIPAGAKGQQMRLYFDNVLLVDSNGQKITQYNALEDTVTILGAAGIVANAAQPVGITVSPNPSSGRCNVRLSLPLAGSYQIELRDISGKLLLQTSGEGKAGLQEIHLATEALSAGIYLVSLNTDGQIAKPVKWIKQ